MKTPKEVAKEIVITYLPNTAFSAAERLDEICKISEDDKVLLKHINVIINIMKKAKKQIQEENKND